MTTFWVEYSASDGALIGVAIVDADDNSNDIAVVDLTIAAGIAPRSAAIHVRRLRFDAAIPASYRNRLLSADEAAALIDGEMT